MVALCSGVTPPGSCEEPALLGAGHQPQPLRSISAASACHQHPGLSSQTSGFSIKLQTKEKPSGFVLH